MRRFGLVMTVVAAAAVALVSISTTGSAQSSFGTFRWFDGKPTSKRIDAPPRGGSPSVGDVFVFNSRLFDTQRKPLGSHRGTCTVLTTSPFRAQCAETLVLPGFGQIFLAGVAGDEQVSVSGIVGGSGSYEHARGTVTTRPASGGGDTLELRLFY